MKALSGLRSSGNTDRSPPVVAISTSPSRPVLRAAASAEMPIASTCAQIIALAPGCWVRKSAVTWRARFGSPVVENSAIVVFGSTSRIAFFAASARSMNSGPCSGQPRMRASGAALGHFFLKSSASARPESCPESLLSTANSGASRAGVCTVMNGSFASLKSWATRVFTSGKVAYQMTRSGLTATIVRAFSMHFAASCLLS